MTCKLCNSGSTSKFGKDQYEQTYCHDCGGHEYKGLLINRKDWDRWVNSEVQELVGQPVVEQLELIQPPSRPSAWAVQEHERNVERVEVKASPQAPMAGIRRSTQRDTSERRGPSLKRRRGRTRN